MGFLSDKEKIKRDIDLIEDETLLHAISELIQDKKPAAKAKKYKNDTIRPTMLAEPPLTDEEMAIPGGRTPTRAQIEEWIERGEKDEFIPMEEAFAQIKKELQQAREKRRK